MSKPFAAGFIILFALILSACQVVTPAPTAAPQPPPVVMPTPMAAPTTAPQHPETRTDAQRLDFSTTTMISSPGELKPGTGLQAVFNAEAGRKLNIDIVIESGSGAALSLWGADGTVLVPEVAGITEWDGVLSTAQDYYLNFRNTAAEPLGYRLTIKMAPLVPPQATRIQFKPGATGGSTQSELAPNSRLRYVLGIMAGQQMTISLSTVSTDIDAYLYIWGADGTVFTPASPVKEWSGLLPVSQDYYVEVVSASTEPINYQLTINIPPIKTPAAPATLAVPVPKIAKDEPIRFDEGAMSVEIDGALISGERDRYTLSAKAGETLEVMVTSLEDNAAFTILGPDNKPLPGTEEGKDCTDWAKPVPADGTYAILVGSTRGNAAYTLKVDM